VITRYGGTVEKFIGDAVMAVWGTPVANEDDAERTVRSALDLVEAVAALGGEVGAPELRARAGVLTGEATVNLAAQGEGMVAGDLVNTASRIQSVAEPGSVFVGGATKRSTDAAIAYEDTGTHELKGKAEPVRLYRALRVVAGVRGALKSEGLEAPFVGRDRELRMVKDLFHATCDGGKAHLVSVVGIAGIGKSRLSWEFYKYMDGLSDLYRWHRGRCLAYGEGVAYWALAEMVRGRAEILEGEDPESAAAKLHATVERYLQGPEERRWVEPRLAHLLGLEDRAGREKEDLFAGWRLFFERMAEDRPVIMSFEDCQWADSSLLEFIDYLLEWSRSHPIFVLAMARPELLERRSGWGTGRSATSLYMEPLSPEAMRELLDGLVPGLPPEVKSNILARAEGVPLYAVETVRMLLDRGLLVREGSAYRPTGPIETLEVPETLHALIAARLDGLTPEERHLVQDASVLGKTFTRTAIAALSGLTPPDLEGLLGSLVRKEILGIQTDPRSPERGQYGFLQDLMRRVAYDTLSKRDRKAKHLAVASYLEEAWGAEEEEIVEVVASHYVQAHDLDPGAEDAPSIRKKAKDMLARAGDRAASLAASAEAKRYFEQAAELADEALMRADLLDRAGRMAWMGGDVEGSTRLFEQSIALYESEGHPESAARVSGRLADIESASGRLPQAIERLERAVQAVSTEEAGEDLADLAARLGALHFFAGNQDKAAEPIALALQIAEVRWLPEVLSRSLIYKGILALWGSRPEETLALTTHALKIALDNDLPAQATNAYFNLSDQMFRRDRYADALGYLQEALALARRVGDRLREWELLSETTYPLYMTGQWDQALSVLAEIPEDQIQSAGTLLSPLSSILEIHIHRGDLTAADALLSLYSRLEGSADVQERSCLAGAKATLCLGRGQYGEAFALGMEAVETRHSIGMAGQSVKQGFIAAAEAALGLGDNDRAEDLVSLAEGLARGERPPLLEAHTSRFRARLAETSGTGDFAAGFKAAAGLFRELDTPFWLGVTLLEHGEHLAREGRTEEMSPLLDESKTIFEGLGAKPWIERLERVASGHSEPLRPTPVA
jgi:predicted ATPase